jgi:hypothetical protein
VLNDLLKVNIWRTGIYQSVFSNSGNKPGLPTQDELLTWLTNRFPPYLPVTPQKQAQVRGRAGFCRVRIGLRPMMKHPCFMY